MARNRIEELLVQLKFQGAEELKKISGGFRELAKAVNLADADIEDARTKIIDYGKTLGNTNQAVKGTIQALKALQDSTNRGGEAWVQLSRDVLGFEQAARLTGREIESLRRGIVAEASAHSQSETSIRAHVSALQQLRAQSVLGGQVNRQLAQSIGQLTQQLDQAEQASRAHFSALNQALAVRPDAVLRQFQAYTEVLRDVRATAEQAAEAQQRLNQLAGAPRIAARRELVARTGIQSDPAYQERFGLAGRSLEELPDVPAALSLRLRELQEDLNFTTRNTQLYVSTLVEMASVQRQASATTQGFAAALREQLASGQLAPTQKNLQEVIGALRREMLELDTTTTEGGRAYAENARQADVLERQLKELASSYRNVADMATQAATAERSSAAARVTALYMNNRAVQEQAQAMRDLGTAVRSGVAGTPLMLPAAGMTSAPGTGQARSGGARNRLVDAAANEFVDGVEATFSDALTRRLKTAGERSGYFNPPTAAVGAPPAVGMSGEGFEAQIKMQAKAAKDAAADLSAYRVEIQRAAAANNGSINSIQRYRDSLVTLRNTLPATGAEFKQLSRQVQQLDAQLERSQRRRRSMSATEATQAAGAVISGGIFGGPEGAIGGIAGTIAGGVPGAFAGAAIGAQFGMIRQQLGATAEYAASIGKLQIALRGVVGSQSAYDQAIRAAAAATRDLNIPQEEATRGLTRLSAAVIGAGGSVADSTFAFRAISEAIKATGGNAEQVDGALLALTQVFSKGKVSAEELNQIAERLPGTFTLFAQAAGKTGPELQKALQQGQVGLNDLMKFLALAGDRYRDTAAAISSSSQDAGARLTVAFQAMRLEVGKSLQPLGAEFQEAFTAFIKDITPAVVGSAKALAAALSFFADNKAAGGLATFALQLGAVALALKGLQAAAAGLTALNIASWFAGAATGVRITGDAAAAATPKIGLFKSAVTGLGTALKALIPLAVLTITVDVITKGLAQLIAARKELEKLKNERNPVPGEGEGIGPKLVLDAQRRYTGASREKITQDQQEQQKFVANLRKQLQDLEATQSGLGTAYGQTAIGAIANIGQGFEQENTKATINLLKEKIKVSEDVLNLNVQTFKTETEIEKIRQAALNKKFASPDGQGEGKAGASFLQVIEERETALLDLRIQREEQLAQIREQAAEQAEQIETQLADRRLAIERQIQDITRQRSESAEDSERRIRAARGENAGLIEAEQKIVDIFREERESRIDSERRLADDTKEQEETIANFQKGVAKNINDANRAHTRSMGEIQKRYATSVAKIIDEGTGKAGKRLVVAGELLQRMLDRANLSQVRASVNYGGGYLPPIPKPRTVGGTLSYPGFERDPAAVPEKFKQLDRQILDLERKLQASRLNGIGQQFTALLGAEGGYEDLAMTRGQAAIIIKKLEAAAVQRNITPDAFATALQEIGDLAQSPDASRRTIRNLMATPGAGIAVRSPGLLRNLATRQLSQDQANIQASGVNPASLTKQIEPMLAIIGQLQKDNLLRKNVSLSETKEQIQKPLYAALMDWVKANLNNTQLQEILERSIMGGNVDTYGAKGLLPLAAGFKPASFGVGLTPAAIKADQEAEARRRYEATPAGRAEKAREEEYARKFREIQMKLGPRSEAIGPGSFDTVKIATDFGEIASASFINGLLAQNSGVSRPYQVGDYVGGSPSAPPARLRPPVIPSAPATTQLRNNLAQREAQARQAKTAQLVKEAFADINAEAAQFTNGLNDQLRLLQDQRKYLDMGFSDSLSRDLANLDKGLMDREAVIRRTTDQLILSVQAAGGDPTAANAAYAAEVARSREIYDLQVKITQELEKQTEAIRLRQDDRIGMGVREGALAYVESIGTMREATAQLTQTGIKGVEDALFSLVTTGTANFREFAAEILRQSARMILQLTIQRVLMQIIGAIGGGSTNLGSSAANVAQYASLPNAMGNAFASNNIIPYANGGIVNRPTMFKFARGGAMATGVMGEAGPEAIMPLKRGADGKLGVASAGGSNVTVNVSVDAKGTQVQGDPGQGAQLGRVIAGAVQQELIKQQRPGGLLAGAK